MKALKCKTLGVYIVYNRRQYAYADESGSVRGSMRKFGKDKALSSSSLLPTLRGISGTALPTVAFCSALETSVHGKASGGSLQYHERDLGK